MSTSSDSDQTESFSLGKLTQSAAFDVELEVEFRSTILVNVELLVPSLTPQFEVPTSCSAELLMSSIDVQD